MKVISRSTGLLMTLSGLVALAVGSRFTGIREPASQVFTPVHESIDLGHSLEETSSFEPYLAQEPARITPIKKTNGAQFSDVGTSKSISYGLSYLKEKPGQRFALAFVATRSRAKHVTFVWYRNIPNRGLVLVSDDGTGYGQFEILSASQVSSLHIPTNPHNNAPIRRAIAAMSRHRNPKGTCLASVIGTSRRNLLQLANRNGANFSGGMKQPGNVFMSAGFGTMYPWQFEGFALSRPDLLKKMGFTTLAVGNLLTPTKRHFPKLLSKQGLVNEMALPEVKVKTPPTTTAQSDNVSFN